jgi:hypothetical protein
VSRKFISTCSELGLDLEVGSVLRTECSVLTRWGVSEKVQGGPSAPATRPRRHLAARCPVPRPFLCL